MKTANSVLNPLILMISVVLFSCTQAPQAENNSTTSSSAPDTESITTESGQTTEETATATTGESGMITFRANGEDFVRQGFVSKDGWQIDFDNLYVHITDAEAYETFTPYDAEAGGEPEAKQEISLVEQQTVDLAAGDEDAETILVNQVAAPAGRYNAISWRMTPAADGPAAGQVILIKGMASKEGQTIPFTLKLDQELEFTCGDYVGDERKGILQPGGEAEVEATFHFDHLFGDGEAGVEDEINTGALGFEPIAAIAQQGQVDADLDSLEAQLSQEDYDKLMKILPDLGHVGEGHCKAAKIGS